MSLQSWPFQGDPNPRKHCRVNICWYFGWVWQISETSRLVYLIQLQIYQKGRETPFHVVPNWIHLMLFPRWTNSSGILTPRIQYSCYCYCCCCTIQPQLLFGLSKSRDPKSLQLKIRAPKHFPTSISTLIYAKLFSGVWHHQELPWWERTI